MRRTLLRSIQLISIVFFTLSSYAQNLKYCGTSDAVDKALKDHPEFLLNQQQLEQFTQVYQQLPQLQSQLPLYRIPVVFHIVHNYGVENISDAQILDAMSILNRDFRKQNADTSQIVTSFKSSAADCEIEFQLAQKDPSGNCTNGIDRIASAQTYIGDDGSKLNLWPTNRYLNIWVVNSMISGAAGYSYLPGTAPTGKDGVMILYDYVGSIGEGSVTTSRTLTHEVGHYLNLLHTWGSGNIATTCGNDFVGDTPTTKGWSSCNLTGSTCSAVENVQNYMEYSFCSKMYTTGQKSRMRAALVSGFGQRNQLWSTSNLTFTGTNGVAPVLCSPVADFKANTQTDCSGATLTFTDLSWRGAPSSWSWQFPGGTPSSSTTVNPTVVYNAAGVYNVSLTVSNSAGSDTEVKNSYINISSATATYNANFYSEGFEGGAIPNTDWIVNDFTGGAAWQQTSSTSYTGAKGVRISNFSNPAGSIDELISPSINLVNIPGPLVSFKVAYVQKNSSSADRLEVFCSSDCGKTWSLRYNKSGTTLATTTMQSSSFAPTAQSQWRNEFVNVAPFINKTNVLFKFKFTAEGGNNIYVDDINIVATLTVSAVTENTNELEGLTVYPNPASDRSTISFTTLKSGRMIITISDLLGREIEKMYEGEVNSGEHSYRLNTSNYKSGIYFVNITMNSIPFSRKLFVAGARD